MLRWCVCAVEYYFDQEQDGSRYRATEVLQVCNSEKEAEVAAELMGLVESDHSFAVIASDKLLDSHR